MYRILGLLSVLVISASITHAQETHIVDLAGTGDFTTIHDAVEAASAGDTIRVQPDQYAFTADLGAVEVDKRLYIIGSGYMPVEEGGTELVDISNTGYFDLTGSADGTVIKGFRVNGASDFVDTQSGTADVIIEENMFITENTIIELQGTSDIVRSNIFVGTGNNSVYTTGTNTQITNNLFTQAVANPFQNTLVRTDVSTGVVIAYNLFINNSLYWGIRVLGGSPEIFSNGFANNTQQTLILDQSGTTFITNNGFHANTSNQVQGLNPVDSEPGFENFDSDNSVLDLEALDENDFDLTLATGSGWIDMGRTGTPYLDLDGSRSDIGLYSGPVSFSDGRGAPSVPVVIQFQVSPTTVSPSGTITITATGRIGDGD